MELDGAKILVIGGAGFIGSHVVEELLDEPVHKIVVFDNFCRGSWENLSEALKDERVSVFPDGGDIRQVDVLDRAMEGVDYVFHLAALWLLHCHEYPRSAFDVNIAGTFNVLEACVKHKVKKLIYSSSASVYGDAVELPMTEDHPYNNRTFYGATKIAGEHMLQAFHHRYGLPFIGLRYMNVFGPRQDYHGAYVAVIMKMLDNIWQGQPPVIYGDGSQSYDFVYVGDVARANLCALKAKKKEGFYNIGKGFPVTIKDLATLLLAETKSGLQPVYEEQGQTFVTQRLGSTEKALDYLGFRAKVNLPSGLRRLIRWRQDIASTDN